MKDVGANIFRIVCSNDVPIVEYPTKTNIIVYEYDTLIESFEKGCQDNEKMLISVLTNQAILTDLKLSELPLLGAKNYQYLRIEEKMQSWKKKNADFQRNFAAGITTKNLSRLSKLRQKFFLQYITIWVLSFSKVDAHPFSPKFFSANLLVQSFIASQSATETCRRKSANTCSLDLQLCSYVKL